MNVKEAASRIKYLREQITYNSRLYYENDAPEISDYEYDMMYAELKKLDNTAKRVKSGQKPNEYDDENVESKE